MSLTQIVKTEKTEPTSKQGERSMIYSPKLDKYVPLDLANPKGDIQKYNIGIAPGSWY